MSVLILLAAAIALIVAILCAVALGMVIEEQQSSRTSCTCNPFPPERSINLQTAAIWLALATFACASVAYAMPLLVLKG